MSLNKDMHVRNPYKDNPPDFKELAMQFPEFRKHCTMSVNGKVFVNFQEDAAVRCLTKTLLKKDFNLDVDLPVGTLVPRVPQRLNYCLFIEDLLKINQSSANVVGIDIGTGASCIYALLGARHFGWKFIATDGDEQSVAVAHKNVTGNGLGDQICVAHVDSEAKTVLMDVINEFGENNRFSFCMCNPPFFETSETDQKFCAEPSLGGEKYSNRVVSVERCAPHSTTFASSAELQVEGGEIKFVNRIIDDSIILRDRIGIYTSMLGRKQSIKPLKRRLERLGDDVKVIVSTINQGRTQRWILAWTFSPNIVLSHLQEKPVELRVATPGLVRIEEQIKALDGTVRPESKTSVTFECRKVTWTHQRARRRAEARKEQEMMLEVQAKRARLEVSNAQCGVSMGTGDGRDSLSDNGNFVSCERTVAKNSERKSDCAVQAYFPIPEGSISTPGIRFRVTRVSSIASQDVLNFELLNGPKQQFNQLLQYLRNQVTSIPKK